MRSRFFTSVLPLSLITLSYLFLNLLLHWSDFIIRYPLSTYEAMYSQSQYVLGESKKYLLGDGDLYVYAGIRYLQGESPTRINFEHPPLGKMLYGGSYLLTGYPNLILIPLTLIAIAVFWRLSGEFGMAKGWRYLALVLFLGHSTIMKESTRTMLDFPLTVFILLTTLCYVKWIRSPTYVSSCWFGFVSGCLCSIKYPLPLSFLYFLLLTLSAVYRRLPFRLIGLSCLIALTTYTLTYTCFFSSGQTWVDFLAFEWWRWRWFQGKTANPAFLLLEVIFLGRYPQWWQGSGYVMFPHWQILWPLLLILYVVSYFLKDRSAPLLKPYKIWVGLSFLISLIGVYEDRFLTPFIPAFALYSVITLKQGYGWFRARLLKAEKL